MTFCKLIVHCPCETSYTLPSASWVSEGALSKAHQSLFEQICTLKGFRKKSNSKDQPSSPLCWFMCFPAVRYIPEDCVRDSFIIIQIVWLSMTLNVTEVSKKRVLWEHLDKEKLQNTEEEYRKYVLWGGMLHRRDERKTLPSYIFDYRELK